HLINDSDLGLHLKGGQWILENHRFPSTDTYTTTLTGHAYLDIHWLYQVLLYGLYQAGGYPLIEIFHGLLIAATGFLAFKRLRLMGASLGLCVLLLLTTVLACEIRFRVRPEVASWLLLSLTLWVLELRANRGRDLLFLLLFIQLVWVNVEGLFILRWGLMGIHWISGFFEPQRQDRKLLRYSLLSVAVCVLNPYFLRGMAYPIANFITLTDPVMHNSLKELQSPWLATPSLFSAPTLYLLLYKLFCLFLFGLMAATYRKRKIRDWLLALVFFGLSASAFRNIPIFMVTSLPLAATAWKDLEWKWFRKGSEMFLSKALPASLLTLLLLGLCLRVVTGAYYVSDRRTDRFGLGLDPLAQPVKACEFLVENHLNGKILNQLDAGGWLDWKGPQKTFIDGRFEVSGRDFYSEYLGADAPGGLGALAGKYQADILFFSPLNSTWVAQLSSLPDWRPVYLDPSAVICLRKGYADGVPSLDDSRVLSEMGVSKAILTAASSLLEVPPPSAWSCFLDDFHKPVVFPDDLANLAIFFGTSGHAEAAEAFFLEAIQRSRGRYYDFYYNLGLLYGQAGKRQEWDLCMFQVLKRNPPRDLTRQISGI
ncbi:MAG TPA: hypothetical protein VJ873_11825, partial [bacterium]|nr:hypothetical protein [bacterium]